MFLFSAPQIGSFRFPERPQVSSGVVNLTQRRSSVRPLNAEPQRNDSVVPLAATIVAPGTFPALCYEHYLVFMEFSEIKLPPLLIGGDSSVF